jgi:hypothetical protein
MNEINNEVKQEVETFSIKGKYTITHMNKDREVLGVMEFNNIVVNSGLTYILQLVAKQPSVNLYIGLFSGNYTPVAGDVASTFPASATEFTGYNESTRVLWNTAVPSGLTISNSASKAEFNITVGGTIYGAFISTASAKNDTTGTLYSAKKSVSPRTVVVGDILLVQYDNTIASA